MIRRLLTLFFVASVLLLKSQSIGDSLHAVHYEINITDINTVDRTLSAHTSILITPVEGDISGISLELIALTVDSVIIDGAISSFSHENGVVQIPLSESISIGETKEVTLYYQGQPFHEGWGGFHFSGEYAFNLGVGFVSIPHNLGKAWFPCIDDFTDRATYDLYVTVENAKKAIGGGILIETIDNGKGTTTWHWQLNHDIPTYLASVMVGDYVLSEDEYIGIEENLPIQIYSRPQDEEDVPGSFVNLKEITLFFENHFGPYPFGRIGFTGTSLGAMEHATNISYPYSGFNGNTSLEWWYTHELSHMWFGDMVTCSTAEDMWLNEGWATFCQIFYLEGLYSHEDFLLTMRDKHQEVLKETHNIDDGYYALNNIPQEYTYGSTAYDKGATVTNALRTYLGDTIFFDAITAYLQNFAFKSVSSYDMRDFLTSYTGIDMSGFFDTWVFTPGTPHYSIDSTKYSEGQIDIWSKHKFKGFDYVGYDHIVQIAYLKDNFDLVFDTITFSGKTGHSVKLLDFQPLAVLVDPMERMMDATIDNYQVFNSVQDFKFPETYFKLLIEDITDSAFVQATHNWVYPDSLQESVSDLRLSPTRYWKIDGYFPEGMQAKGRFFYDNSNDLDGELINSESDSVVILFRESAAEEWHIISQNRVGIWFVGHIFVDDLKKGEYTLAIHDLSVGDRKLRNEFGCTIFPNPSKGHIKVELETEGDYLLKLHSTKGVLIDSLSFTGKTVDWKPGLEEFENGSYLLNVYSSGKLICSKKVVFIK